MKDFITANTSDNIPQEKNGRILVWHDEFDGKALNNQNWRMSRSMNCEGRIYDNSEKNLRVENNNLHMQIHRCRDTYSNPEGVVTRDTMNFKYGYLEMRAKVPYRHCAWPSFWLLGNTYFHDGNIGWFTEVDVFEVFSSEDSAFPNIHKWGKPGHEQLPGGEEDNLYRGYRFENPETLNDEYHVYGFEWDEHDMKFYVDDVCYYSVPIDERCSFVSERYPTTEGFHEPLYILLNNEMFTEQSTYKPLGTAATPEDPMPIDYYVDWVRLYQYKDNERIYSNDEISAAANK